MRSTECCLVVCAICRKGTILVAQVFTLLGAGCGCACVAASAPELLMVGRVLLGINSGQFSLNSRPSYVPHLCVSPVRLSVCPVRTITNHTS